MRKDDFLVAPHERNDYSDIEKNEKYLKYKLSKLSSKEKNMVLMINEIHVKRMLQSDVY